MTVPFTPMAPGIQSRAVLQIIGRRDATLNPTGIRYLPLDEIDRHREAIALHPPRLSDVATAVSSMQLLASYGTLALSAATLTEVRKLGAKVDVLVAEQRTAHKRLVDIAKQLESVSLQISEGRLAAIVEHAIRSAVHDADEISFVPFTELAHDLEGFLADAGVTRGLPVGLRVGSDLRAGLRRVCQLLQGVRLHVARFANEHSAALDVCCVCHAEKDYWPDADLTSAFHDDVGMIRQMQTFNRAASRAHRAVDTRFRMNNALDHEALQTAMNDALIAALVEAGVDEKRTSEVIKSVRASFPELDQPEGIPYLDPAINERYGKALLEAVRESAARARAAGYYPRAIVEAAMQDKLDGMQALDDWRAWWLHQTDVGLLYRTYYECRGVRDGYARTFESMRGFERATLQGDASTPPQLLETLVPPIRVEFQDLETIAHAKR